MGPDPALNPELIQAQSFTSSFRGYDQAEVRSFLSRVSSEVRSLRERVEQLDSAWHSAEERAARPPVIDEDTLMAAVGDETASILRTARAAATEMRAKAAEESEKTLSEARAEAEKAVSDARGEADQIGAEIRAQREQQSRQAAESAERIVATARADSAQLLDKSRAEADAIRVKADQDRAMTIDGANATRDRILEDLVRRRRIAEVQIEQLRAGRERLMESYAVVRRTLEEALSELSRADAEARAAADEVGRRLRSHDLPPVTARPSAGVILDEEGPGGEPDPPEVTSAERSSPEESPPEAALAGVETDVVQDDDSSTQNRLSGTQSSESPASETPASETPASETEAPATDGPAAEAPGGYEPATSAVDELFAKIRSTGRARSSSRKASKAPANATAGTGTATLSRVDETATTTAAAEVEAPVSEVPDPGANDEGTPEPEDSREVIELDADESLLQRREAALGELEAGLTRKLKRALQDEQNDLLDRLRGLKEFPVAADLLPPLDEHLEHYESAAIPLLDQAASAGASFASEVFGLSNPALDRQGVDDLATEAATGIVEPLRRRLEQAVTSSGGDDQTALVESLGAAYREWKSQRIERISGDVLYAAFARGTWSASPEGSTLRWIVDDIDGPCPDCDDDALAGLIAKGEEFPTGQQHPPAHSGCRCLLVPSLG